MGVTSSRMAENGSAKPVEEFVEIAASIGRAARQRATDSGKRLPGGKASARPGRSRDGRDAGVARGLLDAGPAITR